MKMSTLALTPPIGDFSCDHFRGLIAHDTNSFPFLEASPTICRSVVNHTGIP